ncbi:MAG: hypothetical protein QW607_01610 [Desulfurococcaceae archaeon]
MFRLLIFLGVSIFNGYMIAMLGRLNINWIFCGTLFFATSLVFIFVLIYSSRVYIFRDVLGEKIYGFREYLWNISMLAIFLTLGITYLHNTSSQTIVLSLILTIIVSIPTLFYLVVYIALSKSIPSKIDKAMIWFFIGIAYTMTWLYVIITAFNVITIALSIYRILEIYLGLGIHLDAVSAVEEITKHIVMNDFTPFALILTAICITVIELNKAIKEQNRNAQHNQ